MEKELMEQLVIDTKLQPAVTTGEKENVKAYFVLFKGQLQLHYKYGKTFYVFNVKEATPEQREYNKSHNIRGGKEITQNSDGLIISTTPIGESESCKVHQ